VARGRLGRYLQYPHLHPAPLGEAGLIVGVCDDFVFALDPKGPRLRKLASDPSLLGTTGFLVDVEGTLHYASRTRWRTCRLQAVWPAKAPAGESSPDGKPTVPARRHPQEPP